MNIEDFIKEERKFAKYEVQLKVRGQIPEEDLYMAGATKIGSTIHEDKYFIPKGSSVSETKELVRIRREGGESLLFTYKGPVANKKIRNRVVIDKSIEEKDITNLRDNYVEIVTVNKKRTIYILDKVLISLDRVEHLGDFVEFVVDKKEDSYLVEAVSRKFSYAPENSTRLSYFELALMDLSLFNRFLSRVHEKFGKFSFGISSAVMTTLGIIIGLNSATESKVAILGGILTVAFTDSFSDAIGIYNSKKIERGVSSVVAFRTAFNAFIGKIIFTLTFIFPFLFLPTDSAIYTSIIWGLVLFAFVNIQIAFIQEENIAKSVIKNLLIAFFVIILAYFVGKFVAVLSPQ